MRGLDQWIRKHGAPAAEQRQPESPNLPLPDVIEVHLSEGTHPKNGVRQWQGHYLHVHNRYKVVCTPPRAERLPTAGERWRVRLNFRQTVPGMIFGEAEASLEVIALFDKPEHEVVISSLVCRRSRGYGGTLIVEWEATASLLDGRVRTSVEVPQGTEIPQPGETWRVETKRSYSRLTLVTKAIARLSEPTARPIPTDEFVVFFPDHDYDDPIEHNGWPLKCSERPVGHYRCHFKCIDGDALRIEVIGFSAEPTETWITKNLVRGAQVQVRFDDYEAEGHDDFGYDGKVLEVNAWDGDNGVNLELTLMTSRGFRESVVVNHAVLVGDGLLGTCALSRYIRDGERCYVSVF